MPDKFELKREVLYTEYQDLIRKNPGLERIEAVCRTQMTPPWTDEEIRTAQLLYAVVSNASLLEENRKLKTDLHALATGAKER